MEPLSTKGNNLSIRQFIVLFSGGAAPGSFNLLLIVKSHIGKLFLIAVKGKRKIRPHTKRIWKHK
uniref:Actin n=1 Tax=Solanum tuberosum TaxID=4113 RepID=M1BLZ1_SOLTU